ncbi:MAG: hypothetical protein M1818_002235 [Claussenomyces sp. TS43310]|nr:MAG: hypothetical protein M1818_002235 [Claussenomyces sp. TS43310]
MGIISKAFQATIGGAAATVGTFAFYTRNAKFVPLSPSDPIFSSKDFIRQNPNLNPCTQDLCIKRVPLSKIKPQLLEKDGKLIEKFVAGVFSGPGYAFQRAYLERKYKGPETEHQLWSRPELKSSSYEVGQHITDHFEVVEHTSDKITVRCGGSPRVRDVREGDGLFEMFARQNKDEGVVEFGMKSVFFQGLGRAERAPMPSHIVFLHQQYTKLWMESGVGNVTL